MARWGGREEDKITLDIKFISNPSNEEKMKLTLLHEIQHEIQAIEGFSRGSNLSDVQQRASMRRYADILFMPEGKQFLEYKENIRKAEENFEKAPGCRNFIEAHEKAIREMKDFENTVSKDNLKYLKQAYSEYQRFLNANLGRKILFDLYLKVAGEQEAREVENRARLGLNNYADKDLRLLIPTPHRDDMTIF